LAHSSRSKSFTLLKNLSPLFEKVEDCKLEAFMELMCNCLSFDFDFGLSFMYREKEIAGCMCILWQGFCTSVAHTPRGLKEIPPYLKQPGFCVPVFGYTNYFINLSPLTQPFLTAILGQSGKCHGWLSGTMGKLSPMQTSCQLVSPPPQPPPPPPPPLTNEYRAVEAC